MRNLILITVTILLSSCSSTDPYQDFAKLPRNDVQGVAAATTVAIATPDLDLDGNVNGLAEWEAFIRAWVQAYQAARK